MKGKKPRGPRTWPVRAAINKAPLCLARFIKESEQGRISGITLPPRQASSWSLPVNEEIKAFLARLPCSDQFLSDGMWHALRRVVKGASFEREAENVIGGSLIALYEARLWERQPLKSKKEFVSATREIAALARQLAGKLSIHHKFNASSSGRFVPRPVWKPILTSLDLREMGQSHHDLPPMHLLLENLAASAEKLVAEYESLPAYRVRPKTIAPVAQHFQLSICKMLFALYPTAETRALSLIGGAIVLAAYDVDATDAIEIRLRRIIKDARQRQK